MVKLLDWIIFPETCTIRKDGTGEEVRLLPRTMDVLRYLIDAHGQVVTNSELLEKFWSKSVCSDHAVHNTIADLRSALGDRANSPRYIKTYPKRGYLLIARPIEISTDSDESQSFDGLSRLPAWLKAWKLELSVFALVCLVGLIGLGLKSKISVVEPDVLLVRAFKNINVDASNRYWADQLPASLVTHLSKLPNTKVVGGFGDFAPDGYDQTAYPGEIDYVLRGSVQQVNNELRLQVDLVKVKDHSIVFSDQIDISSNQVFDVHDEVGNSIVAALSIYLDEHQRKEMQDWGTSSPVAYSLFLKADFHASQSNHKDLELAIDNYTKATEEDPNFVNAYIGLALTASKLGLYSHEAKNIQLRALVNSVLREVIRIGPDDDSLRGVRNLALRLEGYSQSIIEENLKKLILSGNAPDYAYPHYATLLTEARLYDEANQYLNLNSDDTPFQISLDATRIYRTFFETPENLIQVQKQTLLERPAHIGVLAMLTRGLAFTGNHRQAKYYLQRQMEIDDEGAFSMLSQVIISGLWGSSTRCGDQFEENNTSNPNYHFSHGTKSFIVGDVESGIAYWRSLSASDTRRLSILAHKVEMYFPDEVLEDQRYLGLLEELGIGLSWQRHLMESVMAMSAVTGVDLNARSMAAYNNNEFLEKNNLWNHADIVYPNQNRALILSPPDG